MSQKFGPSLYNLLERHDKRPEPFSVYTARELWADEHTSAKMLEYHLNGEIDVSSRRTDFIDESVAWMTTRFKLSADSRIIDFGCGPGLYTSRFARLGAQVTGVDFSPRSIVYAGEQARLEGLSIDYIEADYLEFEPSGTYDLITMIMCDFCALGPDQRGAVLARFREHLSPDGRAVLDVYSLEGYAERKETAICERNLMDGFWSAEPYYGFLRTFKYDDEKVCLDKYTIVERERQWDVYNWLQYFSPQALETEVEAAGLEVQECLRDVSGKEFDAKHSEFAVVLSKA